MKKLLWALTVGAIVAAITAVVLWQHDSLKESQQELEQSMLRVQELRMELARTEGAMLALEHSLLSSREIIAALRPGNTLVVTAYSATVDQCDDTPLITASNNQVREGICAVSRDLFHTGWQFGKRVFVEDYGVLVIDDLMGSRAERQIDIFMPNRDQALEFGRQELEVVLLDA